MLTYNVVMQNYLDLAELVGNDRANLLHFSSQYLLLDLTNEFTLYELECTVMTKRYDNALELFKMICEYYIIENGPDVIFTEELAAEATQYAMNTFNDEEDAESIYDWMFELAGPITSLLLSINDKLKRNNLDKASVMPYHWDVRIPDKNSLDRLVVKFVCVYKK